MKLGAAAIALFLTISSAFLGEEGVQSQKAYGPQCKPCTPGTAGIYQLPTEEETAVCLHPKNALEPPSPNAIRCGTAFFVMMPLSWVANDGTFLEPENMKAWLKTVKDIGATGVMTDVWWGIAEKAPEVYDFKAYKQFVAMCAELGLKVQAIMSFHQCGGNVGDTCNIPIPQFVRDLYQKEKKEIFYRDTDGVVTQEYVSLFVDEQRLFPAANKRKRNAIRMYGDFMYAFMEEMGQYFGSVITEVEVGMGPAGELRYPGYIPTGTWNYPGTGCFNVKSSYALESLKKAAKEEGLPAIYGVPPSNVGPCAELTVEDDDGDCSKPPTTPPTYVNGTFFNTGAKDNYESKRGKFFLKWYADNLLDHADRVLDEARSVFKNKVLLTAKISGIHWLHAIPSRPAEATSGYVNIDGFYDFYDKVAKVMKKYKAVFTFTALEKTNQGECSVKRSWSRPTDLVAQTRVAAAKYDLKYSGENALPIWVNDMTTIVQRSSQPPAEAFTLLRLNNLCKAEQNTGKENASLGNDYACLYGTMNNDGVVKNTTEWYADFATKLSSTYRQA